MKLSISHWHLVFLYIGNNEILMGLSTSCSFQLCRVIYSLPIAERLSFFNGAKWAFNVALLPSSWPVKEVMSLLRYGVIRNQHITWWNTKEMGSGSKCTPPIDHLRTIVRTMTVRTTHASPRSLCKTYCREKRTRKSQRKSYWSIEGRDKRVLLLPAKMTNSCHFVVSCLAVLWTDAVFRDALERSSRRLEFLRGRGWWANGGQVQGG